MNQNLDDNALQDLIKGIAQNASKKSTDKKRKKRPVALSVQDDSKKGKKLVRKKEAKKHIVVYQDETGNVMQTSFVTEGKDAIAPEMPEVKEELEHHTILFDGWDHDGKNVTSNLVIKPIYKEVPKQYLVMYFGEDGKVLGTEKVDYGKAAMEEFKLQKPSTAEYQYTFVGWNQDLSFIEKDMMVKPVFAPIKRKYTIRFLGDRNRVLDSQNVRYGELPKIPAGAQKPEDAMYYYEFSGWDRPVAAVEDHAQYYAVFHPIYKEYRFRAYIDEELVEDKVYHFKDKITYPLPEKKGYALIWDQIEEEMTDHLTVHGSWDFSNKKGALIENEKGVFRILNPSIHGGSVSLVSYAENKSAVEVPDKTKLGDYYYKITQIEKNAFSGCPKIRQITIGNYVERIEDRGIGGCKGLKKIIFGKNVKYLGKQLFYGTGSLREIKIKGSKLRKISPQAFDQMNGKVKLKADNILPFQLEKIFAKGISSGNILLY